MHADPLQAPLHNQVRMQIVPRVDIRAAGLNHFSWIQSIHDRRTGEDLYPLFRKRFFELDPDLNPSPAGCFPLSDFSRYLEKPPV